MGSEATLGTEFFTVVSSSVLPVFLELNTLLIGSGVGEGESFQQKSLRNATC